MLGYTETYVNNMNLHLYAKAVLYSVQAVLEQEGSKRSPYTEQYPRRNIYL